MAKQLNVNLNVLTNTRDAKKNLEDLSSLLNKISVSTKLNIDDQSLKEAKKAATDLEHHLTKAVNVETGKLDLNKFSQSLSKSGQSLKSLHNQLTKIGPDGQQAFLRLAQSIAQADSSALNLGSKLTQLGTTLKNTARWQISSSILHGFMGALQSAYGYAQDLNKSLNNIRIVTGQSIDDMARFSEQANKAARSLSATTTAYTDAALIYYQQGLDDKAVKERAETTIKLANVSRQSAEEVSSQMTAIWNNFDDGSKKLEYYADVITKLGAATASSSDEIAQGLQKFASVADTVGLSYEKATAALATVVAETRQSADVVGTAFKTMFARFQGLQLGETLEDGVTLNKYSEALGVIGVKILDANGNLRVMDDILDDTAKRWDTITEAQQVALAETVAGTRQYAQFMAIMENYDKILANQDLAAGAEGTLQKQADIYAESWEAASKRVRAAAQGIYQDLLDDKFFISALNGFEKFLNIIDNVIDGLGGLKGILLLISSIFMQHYAKEMPNMIANLSSNISVLTGVAEKRKQQMLDSLSIQLQENQLHANNNQAFTAEQQMILTTTKMTAELNEKRKSLSSTEIQAYEAKIRLAEAYGKNTMAIGAEIDALKRESETTSRSIHQSLSQKGRWSPNADLIKSRDQKSNELKQALQNPSNHEEIQRLQGELNSLNQAINNSGQNLLKVLTDSASGFGRMTAIITETKQQTVEWQQTFEKNQHNSEAITNLTRDIEKYCTLMDKAGLSTKDLRDALSAGNFQEVFTILNNIEDESNSIGNSFQQQYNKIYDTANALKALGADKTEVDKLVESVKNGAISQEEFNARIRQMTTDLDTAVSHTISFSEAMGQMAGLLTQVTMAINSIKNLGNIWSNEDLSNGEKILQTFTAFGTLLPALINLFKASNLEIIKNMFSTKGWTLATVLHTGATGAATAAQTGFNAALLACPIGWIMAGLAALAGIIYLVAKRIETSAEKAKKAAEVAKDLNDAYDSTKQKAEELKSTIESYDSVVKKLDECTEGTKEWKAALDEVNQATMDILQKYPELAGDMKFTYVNGIRIISNLQDIQDKIQKNAKLLQLSTVVANAKTTQANNQVQIDSAYKKIQATAAAYKSYDDAEMNAKGDLLIATASQIFNRLSDGVTTGLDEIINSSQLTGYELDLLKDSIAELVINIDQSNIQLKNAYEQIANDYVIDEKETYSKELQDNNIGDFEDIIAKSLTGTMTSAVETMVEKYTKDNLNRSADDVLEEYAQQHFAPGSYSIKKGVLEHGDEKISKETAARALAVSAAKSSQEIQQEFELQKRKIINTVSNKAKVFSNDNEQLITDILSNNKANINIEDFKKFQLSPEEKQAFADLYNLFNGTNLNAANVEEYVKSVITLEDCYKAQIKDVTEVQQSIQDLDKAFGSLKIGDTVESLDGLSDGMESYFVMMADGTYKLIGYAEEFQEALFEQKAQQYKDNIIATQKYLDNIEDQLTDEEKLKTLGGRITGAIGSDQYYKKDKEGNFQVIDESSVRKAYEDSIMGYAMLASSLKQLDKVKEGYLELGIDELDQGKALSASLQNIAQKYDICIDDLKDYQAALQDNNEELIQATEQNLKFSIAIAQVAEDSGFDKQQTEDYAKRLKKHIAKDLEGKNFSNEQIEQITIASALANQRLDRGLNSLNSQLETYKKNLIDVNKNSFDWSNQMQAFKTDLADILDMDVSTITDEFAESLLTDAAKADVFAKALTGDKDALNDLQKQAAEEIFLSSNIKDMSTEFQGETTTMGDLWEYFKKYVGETVKAGDLDQSELIDAFKKLINAGQYTREQILGMLSNLHITAQLEFDPTTQTWSLKTTDKSISPGLGWQEMIKSFAPNQDGQYAGFRYEWLSQNLDYDPLEGLDEILERSRVYTENLKVIRAFEPELKERYKDPDEIDDDDDDDDKKGPEHHYKEKLLKEEQHRYEDIRNELAALQTSYERVAKAEDLLYGKEKFDSMRKRLQMLEKEEKIAQKLLQANLGDNWEYYYNKAKNGEAITKEDINNAGGYLGGDWDKLTGQQNITIQYQQTENGNTVNKTEDNLNIAETFKEFGVDYWDPDLLDNGVLANPELLEKAIAELEYNMYARVDRTKEGYEEEEARIAAVIEAIKNIYASTTTELQNMNDMIDQNIEYEHKRQDIIDAFPKKHLELITDELHRYDELNKTLEELNRQYEDLGKARERAWGKNKIQLLDQELKKLEQLQGTYEEYLKTIFGTNWKDVVKALQSGSSVGSLLQSGMIGGTLSQDRQRLIGKQGNTFDYIFTDNQGHDQRYQEELDLEGLLGFAVEFDASGNITNWDKIMSRFDEIENERKTKYDNETGDYQGENQYLDQQEAEKEKRRIEVAKERLEQYQDTITAGIDNYEKWLDNQYEQQAKFYENFRYKIDLKIEISERSLKRIEYAIKVLGDNIYKIPEVMQSWFDKRVTATMGEITSQAGTWATAFTDATAAHDAGKISDEDYVQTIKDAQDGLYGCIDALLEINAEMREYYKNVLSKVKEEMSRITDEMEHQLDTVTHLQNVLSLLGRETDYEAIGKVLEAQMKMTENSYEVSKAQAEMYRRQVELAEQNLQDLINQGVSDAALEEWKNAVLYPAEEALREAEAKMQSDFEAYLNVVNAIFENRINKIYQDSERRLSGAWGSFDQLNNAMERQRALDEEYLTKTNQIYETNTLLRKLAQDIDKTNNASSKIKLKNFADEIEGLQQKNKLSKSELDIAKARYEVLQAELALEDAKNAKSTVRLQRDNEGNYGYVYTADQDAIDNAEQNLADKNNDLYNLVLGQANNYTEKIIQLTQQRNNELKDLDLAWQQGRIQDEDTYHKLREDIVNKYNGLIQEDYESYYRALYWLDETATTDHTEAWGTSFQDVLDAEEDFEDETDRLAHETGGVIDWLNDIRAKATDEAKVGNGDLEEQLKKLTEQNDALAKKMKDEVVPSAEKTLIKAQDLTKEWALQYDEIMKLIDAYFSLIDAMQQVLLEMSGLEKEQPEEFDPTKDYSQSATEKFFEAGGVITKEVIQELMYRVQKEELNGGHNEKWATESQILQLMEMAAGGDEQAYQFLQDIMGTNGQQQYYTAENMAAMGITGEGYSLQEYIDSVNANTAALEKGNELTQESKEAVEAGTEQSQNEEETNQGAADQNSESANQVGDAASGLGETIDKKEEDFEKSQQERSEQEQETAEEHADKIEGTTENLIIALNNNADVVSAAVEAAAQVIAYSIREAKAAAYEAIEAAERAEAAVNFIATEDNNDTGDSPVHMASGGYTGIWGSTGKLAVLHEKELVLNAADTENILAAVGLLRDFSSAIDLRANPNAIASELNSPLYQTGSQTLEQSVTIHAEFPNATDHSEIEEAFNTLINRASQYANRS